MYSIYYNIQDSHGLYMQNIFAHKQAFGIHIIKKQSNSIWYENETICVYEIVVNCIAYWHWDEYMKMRDAIQEITKECPIFVSMLS